MRLYPRPGRARCGPLLALAAGSLAALGPAPQAAGAPWVTITEIQYNPLEGDAGEWIEIQSREPPRADLSGWTIEGEVRFRFPEGTVLRTGEHLVIARDLQAFGKRHPETPRAVGPFEGKLDNRRGRLVIRNSAGARVCEARWENGWPWTTLPDGTGHTLSLLDPLYDPSKARNWTASTLPGGTPGRPNTGRAAASGTLLVQGGEMWLYTTGEREPDPKWKDPGFKAEGWASGPTGIGYGDGDDSTEITGMSGQYIAIFARRTFQAPELPALSRLILRMDWDDGFVAYLNG
ncbi:MAG TPA: lamin tail domain-containing protein, partial [Candidatus Methylomirabilis sp.]|nr:lamin tail domain-containing protein [Candidatus Methylomirabilis sp.]